MLGALGPHGGDAGVQHVVDGRVAVEAPLHVVLAVRLVALLVAAVLQTVPLQVLERGAAGGDRAVIYRVGTKPPRHPTALQGDLQGREGPPPSPAPGRRVGTSPPARRAGKRGWGGGGGASSAQHPKTQHPACTALQAAAAPGCGVRLRVRLLWVFWKLRAKQDLKIKFKKHTLNELFL